MLALNRKPQSIAFHMQKIQKVCLNFLTCRIESLSIRLAAFQKCFEGKDVCCYDKDDVIYDFDLMTSLLSSCTFLGAEVKSVFLVS